MTAVTLRRGEVTKTPGPHHPADAPLMGAMMSGGIGELRRYIAILDATGVNLPPDLQVVRDGHGHGRGAVRHRWVSGIPLPHLAAHPEAFLAAVSQIAGWVRDLDGTDARLDTNLANFLLVGDDRLVTVDVLPPLLVSLRPQPRNRWETLFDALCFDTTIILCALAGYAGRALLIGAYEDARDRARDLATAILDLCPGHADNRQLGAWWFHARTLAAAHTLAGTLPAEETLRLFARTSVLAMRDPTELERSARIADARHLICESGLL